VVTRLLSVGLEHCSKGEDSLSGDFQALLASLREAAAWLSGEVPWKLDKIKSRVWKKI